MSVSKSVVITDPQGLHARPAAEFVEKARAYSCDLSLDKDGRSANCKSLLGILKLGIGQGSEGYQCEDRAQERPDERLSSRHGSAPNRRPPGGQMLRGPRHPVKRGALRPTSPSRPAPSAPPSPRTAC